MEIKIICDCGTKFKFDVEPVNGRSPGAVHCPACGKDSTEKTNAMIQERLSAPAASSVSTTAAATPRISVGAPNAPVAVAATAAEGPKVAIPSIRIPAAAPVAAPTPVARVAAAPPPPAAPAAASPARVPAPAAQGSIGPKMAFMPAPASGGTSLSVASQSKPAEPAASPAHATATAAPVPIPSGNPAAAKVVRSQPIAAGNYKNGVIGGTIGAIIGAGIWYFIAVEIIGFRFLAVIPGVIAGSGAIMLGKHGSEKMAKTVATISAVITILMWFAVIAGIKANNPDWELSFYAIIWMIIWTITGTSGCFKGIMAKS